MKRIAAPMVGGLLTSAFLTLEIIPVIVTYWRQEQLLWERLNELAPHRRRALARAALVVGVGLALGLLTAASRAYVTLPGRLFAELALGGAAIFLGGLAAYLLSRRPARALVWPDAWPDASPGAGPAAPPPRERGNPDQRSQP